jgi:hypothetical protein
VAEIGAESLTGTQVGFTAGGEPESGDRQVVSGGRVCTQDGKSSTVGSVIRGFFDYHLRAGGRPLVNPVPVGGRPGTGAIQLELLTGPLSDTENVSNKASSLTTPQARFTEQY